MIDTSRLLPRIEAMGIAGRERHWHAMPPELAKRLRPRVLRIGDALVTLLETSDALRVNCVTGLGHRGEASEQALDAIVEVYRESGVPRFTVELTPGPQAPAIACWLERRGFTRHGAHTLLLRDLRMPVAHRCSGVRVARAKRAELPAVVEILSACFAIPAGRRPWSLATAASGASEQFLAFVDGRPVGTGALGVDRDLAWLGGGATLTRWRGRGAHAALIAARLRRAVHHGCRWAWSETATPSPGRPQGSWRNLQRLGFQPLCVKAIHLWER